MAYCKHRDSYHQSNEYEHARIQIIDLTELEILILLKNFGTESMTRMKRPLSRRNNE